MHATEVFARCAIELRRQRLSQGVLHHAKRAVVDWYASMLPGLATTAVQVLEHTVADDLDRGGARLARGRQATARAVALIGGSRSCA